LEALEALLKETLLDTKDTKVAEKLSKAQELAKKVKVRSKGILGRLII
jgi:hypothetical protein